MDIISNFTISMNFRFLYSSYVTCVLMNLLEVSGRLLNTALDRLRWKLNMIHTMTCCALFRWSSLDLFARKMVSNVISTEGEVYATSHKFR